MTTILLMLALAGAADAPAEDTASGAKTSRATIAPQYQAGAFHRWLWGSDYRALWTAPIEVGVLDMQTFAGGLKPVRRVGGQQTKGLAMKGADGRDYTFRAIDKDPREILPEELRDTWVRNIVQDQMSGQDPASPFVVDELMQAAGILRTEQRLVVMPDDPALGEFRKDFAGVVGQLYEFPGAKSDKNPGLQGATEVLKHADFYKALQSGRIRPDARAFLKARLFDIMIGDWDRHRDQWRWVKFPDRALWQPLPDDRDQAFSRYQGLILDLVRSRAPMLQKYGDDYPAMKGLTWNGWEQDRELLAGLERPLFKEVAAELQGQITDEVIARAARRMPAEYFKLDGERLVRDLKGRRDQLPEAAQKFYEHIADKVRVYLSDEAEYVDVRWLDGGDVQVQVWRRGPDGKPAGDPVYARTLHKSETDEVQIYLRDGDDRVATEGKPGSMDVRVIGGPGHDVVDDTKGGGTHFYDTSGGELLKGPGSHIVRTPYIPPPPPVNAPWIPPRDWGRDSFVVPWLSYGSDLGVFLGLGLDTQNQGFRKNTYASRHIVRAGWALGDNTFRADYLAAFRFENSRWSVGWYAAASGLESSRYFGIGNETSDGGEPNSDFFKVKQQQYALAPVMSLRLTPSFTLAGGPTVKYASNRHKDDSTLINEEQPYGYGTFGMAGASVVLDLDTRQGASKSPGGVALRSIGYPTGGARVLVKGQVWPKAWDVKETFGSVEASAAAYLTPGGEKVPTLALRVGGQKIFGDYPFFEAAYLGGGLTGINGAGWEGTVRGLPRHRYAGDSMVYGNADLRIYVSRFKIVLPGTWGIFGFGDGGRVYVDGEDSDEWHYGYGGGIWLAWLDRANTLSLAYARSEGRNAVYFRAGFAF